MELAPRIVGHGWQFWKFGKDGVWNYMDLTFVTVSLYDMFACITSQTKVHAIMRSVRLLRLLRVLRNLEISGLKKMLVAFTSTLGTMAWALLLLMLMIYGFAVLFTTGASDCLWHRALGCDVG